MWEEAGYLTSLGDLPSKGTPSITSEQQASGPMRFKTAIINPLYSYDGMEQGPGDNNEILHRPITSRSTGGDNDTINNFEPLRAREDLRRHVPVAAEDPRPSKSFNVRSSLLED